MHSCYLKLIVNFRKGKKYLYKHQKICAVYGGFTISKDTLCKWLPMFKSGNFDLKVKERPGIPAVVDDNQIEKLIKNNQGHMTQKYFISYAHRKASENAMIFGCFTVCFFFSFRRALSFVIYQKKILNHNRHKMSILINKTYSQKQSFPRYNKFLFILYQFYYFFN